MHTRRIRLTNRHLFVRSFGRLPLPSTSGHFIVHEEAGRGRCHADTLPPASGLLISVYFTAPPVMPEIILRCASAKMISSGRLIRMMYAKIRCQLFKYRPAEATL